MVIPKGIPDFRNAFCVLLQPFSQGPGKAEIGRQ